jgi:hypothetical protein
LRRQETLPLPEKYGFLESSLALLIRWLGSKETANRSERVTTKRSETYKGGTLYAVKKIRSIALLAITWAVMLSALTFAGSADAATTGHSLCQASGYTQIDGECMHIVRTEKLSPEAGAALEKAFATPAGRVAVQEAFQGIDKAKSGVVVQEPSGRARPAWACPGGVSCGVSHSGGTHFWVIASYAAIYDVGTAGFWAACTGALSPVIDPVAAVAACAVVAGALWALVNNAPWTSQHGVWLAVYRNYWTGGTW